MSFGGRARATGLNSPGVGTSSVAFIGRGRGAPVGASAHDRSVLAIRQLTALSLLHRRAAAARERLLLTDSREQRVPFHTVQRYRLLRARAAAPEPYFEGCNTAASTGLPSESAIASRMRADWAPNGLSTSQPAFDSRAKYTVPVSSRCGKSSATTAGPQAVAIARKRVIARGNIIESTPVHVLPRSRLTTLRIAFVRRPSVGAPAQKS